MKSVLFERSDHKTAIMRISTFYKTKLVSDMKS